MGRWFGYRPGYEDLCRLYTTSDARDAYVEITAADRRTPPGVRGDGNARPHPDASSACGSGPPRSASPITAANKMRQGTKVSSATPAKVPETVIFNLATEAVEHNFEALENFVRRCDGDQRRPRRSPRNGNVRWNGGARRGRSPSFLTSYETDRMAQRVRPGFIAKYIEQCATVGELGSWTVRPGRQHDVTNPQKIGGHTVGLVTRDGAQRPVQGRGAVHDPPGAQPAGRVTSTSTDDQLKAALEAHADGQRRLQDEGVGARKTAGSGGTSARQRRPDQATAADLPDRASRTAARTGEQAAPRRFPGELPALRAPDRDRVRRQRHLAAGGHRRPIDEEEDEA